MKKILTLFAILMVAITSRANAETTWTDVSTAQEFYDAINGNHAANVRLTADIDLTGLSASGDYLFNFTFTGKITGLHDTDKIYKLKNYSKTLFKKIDGATIDYIEMYNFSYSGRDTKSGQLADEVVNKTTIDHCVFAGITGTGDYNAIECDHMGVVAGTSNGSTFTNLTFIECTISADGSYAGIVVGDATGCTFTDILVNARCNVWVDGNLTSYNSAYAGGLCGYADKSQFTNCNNFALVASDDDRVGGILGYGTNTTTITNCNNWGVVKHCTKSEYGRAVNSKNAKITAIASAGSGVTSIIFTTALAIATLDATSTSAFVAITSVISTLGIEASVVALAVCAGIAIYNSAADPDELGGIVGTLDGGSSVVSECTNYGPVECSNRYCGGIVGYLDGATIESCCNRSFVKGNTHTGGIVGYCDEGTVRRCLNIGSASADGSRLGNIEGTYEGTCTFANNYYLSDENTTTGKCDAFTQEKLPSGAIALALNTACGKSVWYQNLGTDFYPVMNNTSKTAVTAATDSYSIEQNVSTSTDFFLAASNPFSHINITSDLDLGNYYFNLASAAHPFKGIIKGNGHTLSNVNYQAEESDADKENTALFPVVYGATFENFTLDGINITHTDEVAGSIHTEAILAATSTNSKYTNITIKNSSILKNSDPDYLAEIGGLVAISTGDEITGCTVESTCKFEGYSGWRNTDTNVGGIVSKAYKTTIKQCLNSAAIWADDNQEGGIAAYAEDCTIADCLNTGTITAQENVGGICGNAVNTVITRCVNTGAINDDDNTREDKRSGIVGVLNGANASVSYCLNFGSVNYADDDCGSINNNRINNATYGAGNYYYCQFNGNHQESLPSGTTYADITSGKFAMTATYLDASDNTNKTYLYQRIDNNISFPTSMPNPIPTAGTVYSNLLCDGTLSYSNRYKSTASHTATDDDSNGFCDECGDLVNAMDMHISNSADLNDFARYVNKGYDFSSATITVDNDIDMSGASFTPIGNATYTFKGTFNGGGHRIKNLSITGTTSEGTGLFGVVGASTIDGIVIDKSCTVTQNNTAVGTAGIVGCGKTGGTTTQSINIYNCGNEANVTSSGKNAGGILGDIDDTNENVQVNIKNCYNTGNISGSGDCGSIIGYAKYYPTIENCWNSGTISGQRTDYPFAGTYSKKGGTIANCYDVNTPQSGVTQIASNDIQLGILCNNLNTNRGTYTAWTQDLGTDTHPTFGTAGIHYTREMSNNWGTIVLPFDITYDATNTDYRFYYLSATSSDALTFTEYPGGIIAAGTPMAIKKLSGDAIDIMSASTPNFNKTITAQGYSLHDYLAAGLTMNGTYTSLTNQTGIYFIAQDQFWYAESPITIAPFRAWFETPTPGAKSFNIIEEDETDGIDLTPALSQGEGVHKYLEGGKVVIVRNGKKFNINGQVLK